MMLILRVVLCFCKIYSVHMNDSFNVAKLRVKLFREGGFLVADENRPCKNLLETL